MRVLGLLFFFCFFWAFSAKAQAPTFDTRDENALVFLSVTADGALLSEGIEGYDTGHGIVVPLSGLAQILGLAITARPDLGYAEGWYFKEDQTFSLDFANKTVTLAGKKQPFTGVLRFEDDFYVPTPLFFEWFGINLDVNFLNQELRATSKTPLPALLTLKRGEMRGRTNAIAAPNYPRVDPPLPFISDPYSDVVISNTYDSEGDPEYQTTGNALTSFKAEDFDVQNFVSTATDDGLTDFRLTLSQTDDEAGLLGPLKARQLALGDIYTPSVSSIAESTSGAGAQISNFPINRINNFSRTTLRGNLPPNWDVELYRNGSLINVTTSSANGQYEFVDVPLLSGTNILRLVFYGPFGEIREETKQFIVGSELIQKGNVQYGLNVNRQNEDLVPVDETDEIGQGDPRMVGEVSYGLTDNIALLGQTASLTLEDNNRYDYVGGGVGFALGGAFFRSLYIDETSEGGYALDNRMQTAIYDINVLTEWQEFKDGFVSEDTESINLPLDRRLNLSLDRYITLPETWPALNLGLDAQEQTYVNDLKEWDVTQRTSTYFGRNSITHELRYTDNQRADDETDDDANQTLIDTLNNTNNNIDGASWDGVLRTSSFFETFDVRSQIFYDIDPDSQITGLNLTGTYDWSEILAIQPSITHLPETDDQDKETEYGLTIIRDYETFQVSANTFYSDQGEFRAGLNLSFSLGRDPSKNNDLRMFRDQIATTGMLDTVAFVDKNGNQKQDADEKALPDVAFQVDRATSEIKTNDTGHAFIPNLPVHRSLAVAVEPSSLEDPAYQSALSGQQVVLRPGVPVRLEFPIVPTGSVEGTVFLNTTQSGQKAGSNVVMELVQGDKVMLTARTAYDGYYLFEFVPPGQYKLRIAPDQEKRLNFIPSPPKDILIQDENSIFSGIDWVIQRGS